MMLTTVDGVRCVLKFASMSKKKRGPTAPNQLDPRDTLLAAKDVEFTPEAHAAAGTLDPLPTIFVLLGKSDNPHCVQALFKNGIEDIRAKSLRPVPLSSRTS
jgi:hypothetical protein